MALAGCLAFSCGVLLRRAKAPVAAGWSLRDARVFAPRRSRRYARSVASDEADELEPRTSSGFQLMMASVMAACAVLALGTMLVGLVGGHVLRAVLQE